MANAFAQGAKTAAKVGAQAGSKLITKVGSPVTNSLVKGGKVALQSVKKGGQLVGTLGRTAGEASRGLASRITLTALKDTGRAASKALIAKAKKVLTSSSFYIMLLIEGAGATMRHLEEGNLRKEILLELRSELDFLEEEGILEENTTVDQQRA